MKRVLVCVALAAAMSLPAAFAQEAPAQQSSDIVKTKHNDEPVAAEVAAVVQSGKRYTTDDLVRAQRAALDLDPGAGQASSRSKRNATMSPGPNKNVFDREISTDKNSSITASATDVKVPNEPEKPATAENTAKEKKAPTPDE